MAIERDVMRLMEGGCQLPLGVYCQKINNQFAVKVSFSSSSSQPGKVLTYLAENTNGLAQKIVGDLKK
ncbi:MAG: hypothetical protein IPM77_02340 [Crocinitomicaceae bacterium]|nr:hypothetical protein [Crocinitomicaceae bacterium]